MDYSFIEGGPASGLSQEIGAVTVPDPFDLARAKQCFAVFESKIKDWGRLVDDSEITDELEAQQFTDAIGKAKGLVKDFEKNRKLITADAYGYYKDVLGFEKYYTSMVADKVIDPANIKLSFYFKQKEIERQKTEKKAQASMESKQVDLDQIADDAGVDRVKLDKPILKSGKTRVVGEAGSATPKTTWLYKVKSINNVPRDFMAVDDKAIRQAIKNGERNIPGLEIYKETTAQVRTRR
jgi:hypothetical protein